ncbi:MAG TPA: hypothetical protein VMS55_12915 [Myxococcota bacterium]|nr:hypothetical protein [Myxococcota bacterium]
MKRLAIVVVIALGAARAHAQDPLDAEGCVYEHQLYPEDTEMCQNGKYVRCIDKAWSDEGDCPDQASQPPISQGGDPIDGNPVDLQ